ncbi:PQ loop repeat protein [Metarhizium anisopliae]|nr:PQ loop repeat protein [Metarhizium anisopliae]
MTWLTNLTGFIAPFFIIMSPIISYGDQILAMHRNKSSAGFSLDIPLIMLVASFFRIFYWPGSRFDASLLVQSFIMVVVQLILLKIALEHRPLPATKGGEGSMPFSGLERGSPFDIQRPYNFWQWRSHKPYWHFLLYLLGGLIVCEVLFRPMEPIYDAYSVLIGYLGLSIEATLPIPQLIANAQSQSCKGFRLSVLAAWIGGDAMKVFWFFTSTSEIPLAFKVCGCFQAACDCLLGIQYFIYGAGGDEAVLKEHAMEEAHWARGHRASHSHTRSMSAGQRGATFSDTEAE